jgi:hypothetical protein
MKTVLKCIGIVAAAFVLLGVLVIDTTKDVPEPHRGLFILLGVAVAAGASVGGIMHVVGNARRPRDED